SRHRHHRTHQRPCVNRRSAGRPALGGRDSRPYRNSLLLPKFVIALGCGAGPAGQAFESLPQTLLIALDRQSGHFLFFFLAWISNYLHGHSSISASPVTCPWRAPVVTSPNLPLAGVRSRSAPGTFPPRNEGRRWPAVAAKVTTERSKPPPVL